MARPSKIGQLPAALRNELNQRLEDGHQAKNLVPWLNKKAQAHFSAASNSNPDDPDPDSDPVEFTPITEQNLSDWRRGGFVEWQLLNGIYEASARLGEASDDFEDIDLDSKRFLILLKARFAGSLLSWDGSCQSAAYHSMNLLLRLIKGVLTMRRSEQQDERRELDLERLELTRQTRETRTQRPASMSAKSKPKVKAEAPSALEPIPAPRPPGVPPPLPAYVQQRQEQTPSASPAPAAVSVAAPGLVTPPAQSAAATAGTGTPPVAAKPTPAAAPVPGTTPKSSTAPQTHAASIGQPTPPTQVAAAPKPAVPISRAVNNAWAINICP